MEKWNKGEVSFNLNEKPVHFFIYNNLPKTFGLSLECAVDNWLARTEVFTDKSLCDYINSKQIGYKAYTASQFAKIALKLLKEERN